MIALLAVVLLAELSAHDVVQKAIAGSQPDSMRETATMTLVDAKGGTRTRSMTIAQRKSGPDRYDGRIEFLDPKDVAGTILLSIAQKDGSSDQHLWLPGLKRVRRVSGSQKSGAFMGSDFAYEDLSARKLEDADYEKLADETVAGKPCFVIQATPHKDVDTGYGKTIAYVTQDDFLTLRMRFFDKSGTEIKTLDVDPAKVKTQGDVRIPQHVEMKSLKDGHVTKLDVTNVEIGAKLDPAAFDPASLDKG